MSTASPLRIGSVSRGTHGDTSNRRKGGRVPAPYRRGKAHMYTKGQLTASIRMELRGTPHRLYLWCTYQRHGIANPLSCMVLLGAFLCIHNSRTAETHSAHPPVGVALAWVPRLHSADQRGPFCRLQGEISPPWYPRLRKVGEIWLMRAV